VWVAELDPGVTAPPHSLTREEIFVVLAGRAEVTLAGRATTAEPGDAIVVPAGTEFGVHSLGDGPLRMLCCMPVGGRARLADGSVLAPPWSV
jgi:mannose-6-phosphate isomerase-like protein (cupin superfamily)